MTSGVDQRVRKFVIRAIRRGVITVSEGARFANVKPQAVQQWVGTGSAKWRERYVAETMRKMLDAGHRVVSKSELRQEAEEAAEAWEWRNGADGLGKGEASH